MYKVYYEAPYHEVTGNKGEQVFESGMEAKRFAYNHLLKSHYVEINGIEQHLPHMSFDDYVEQCKIHGINEE